MHKFWTVFKQEYAQIVKKKSFIISLLVMPVIMIVFMMLPAYLASQKSSTTEHFIIIDHSKLGIADQLQDKFSEYKLDDSTTQYYKIDTIFKFDSDEADEVTMLKDSLNEQLVEGTLKYYLVIGSEALTVDSSTYIVSNAENIITNRRLRWHLSRILSSSRLEHSDINLPIDSVLELTRRIDLETITVKGDSSSIDKKYFIALIFTMLIYMLIMMNGQMVMRSVVEEKTSRIMEVLISSVSPFQLMMGKILGLGAATLTQIGIWIAIGGGLYYFQGATLNDSFVAQVVFNPYILIFFVMFMISGFILYSTFFAFIGAIVNSEKEAQNFFFPMIIFLMLPVALGFSIMQDPNSTLTTAISIFPLSSPTMMMMRLVFIVPTLPEVSIFSGIIYQAIIALVVLIGTIIGFIWLTAKVFRIGILMHGKRPTLPEIIKWIKY